MEDASPLPSIVQKITGTDTGALIEVSFIHVPSSNMEGAEFTTYTADRHQGAIKIIWLDF